MRRNVELKARLRSLDDAREVARRVANGRADQQDQVDTYFCCRQGRLKLREIEGRAAQLIWYARADQPAARQSHYFLLEVSQPTRLKEILGAALGIRCTVKKHREIYLCSNVRIHLDRVEGLGCFVEFEAVMAAHDDPATAHAQLQWLSREFGIASPAVQACSYGDMA